MYYRHILFCLICFNYMQFVFGENTCTEELYEIFHNDYGGDFEFQSINWTITNVFNDSIEIDVVFLTNVCAEKFIFFLKIDNRIDGKKQCAKDQKFIKSTSEEFVHTRLVEYSETHNEDYCKTNGTRQTFRIRHVYTGCYTLQIVGCDIHRTRNYLTTPKYIETNKKIKYIHQTCTPVVIPQHDLGTQLFILKWNSACVLWRDNPYAELHLGIYQSNNEILHFSIKYSGRTKEIATDSKYVSVKFEGDTQLYCYLYNFSAGNYNITITITNDTRCERNTLWTLPNRSECSWKILNNTFKVASDREEPIAGESETPKTSPPWIWMFIIIGSILLLLILYCLCVKLIKMYIRRSQLSKLTKSKTVSVAATYTSKKQSDILLLYARDCPEFMNVMEQFRNILTTSGVNRVYDIYNEDTNKEVCSFQQEWTLEKLRDPNVKILLVATNMAKIYYEWNPNDINWFYKQPKFTDNYFKYASKIILTNINLQTHDKVYVIQLDMFDENDYGIFEMINTHTRYILPNHMKNLIADVTNQDINGICLKQSQEDGFIEALDVYQSFVKKTPTYFQDIVNC